MACRPERSEVLGDLVAGRLDEARSEEFLAHVERCEACSAELDLVCRVVAAHPEIRPEIRPAPIRVSAPIRARVLRRGPLLAAAALILALLSLWFTTARGPARPLSELASVPPLPWSESALRGPASSRADAEALGEAMRAYDRREYERSATELRRLLERDPEAPSADLMRLYRGISLFETDAPEAAALELERASRSAEGLLLERCLWFLAHAQLAAGRPDAARAALDRLIALGGDYELDATEKRAALRAVGVAGD